VSAVDSCFAVRPKVACVFPLLNIDAGFGIVPDLLAECAWDRRRPSCECARPSRSAVASASCFALPEVRDLDAEPAPSIQHRLWSSLGPWVFSTRCAASLRLFFASTIDCSCSARFFCCVVFISSARQVDFVYHPLTTSTRSLRGHRGRLGRRRPALAARFAGTSWACCYRDPALGRKKKMPSIWR